MHVRVFLTWTNLISFFKERRMATFRCVNPVAQSFLVSFRQRVRQVNKITA
jgi:hypothetical protein